MHIYEFDFRATEQGCLPATLLPRFGSTLPWEVRDGSEFALRIRCAATLGGRAPVEPADGRAEGLRRVHRADRSGGRGRLQYGLVRRAPLPGKPLPHALQRG